MAGDGDGECFFCGRSLRDQTLDTDKQQTRFAVQLSGNAFDWVCDACVAVGPDGIRERALEAATQRLSAAQRQLELAHSLQGVDIVMPNLRPVVNAAYEEFKRLCRVAGGSPRDMVDEDIPF